MAIAHSANTQGRRSISYLAHQRKQDNNGIQSEGMIVARLMELLLEWLRLNRTA